MSTTHPPAAAATATNSNEGGSNQTGWNLLLGSGFLSLAMSSHFASAESAATATEHAGPNLSIGSKSIIFGGAPEHSFGRDIVLGKNSSSDSDSGSGSGGEDAGSGENSDSVTPLKPFPLANSSKATSRVYEVSTMALQGDRDSMEDEYLIADDNRFVAVFDGHGGKAVSKYLEENLYGKVCHYLKQTQWEENEEMEGEPEATREKINGSSLSSISAALRAAFKEVDDEVAKYRHVGSTAVVAFVHETDDGRRTLLTANIGDSRAVLSRKGKAVALTKDHKPNDAVEKKRITSMGGKVEWERIYKVHRVRGLAVSRAVGDSFAKPIVSGEPVIEQIPIQEGDDEFIVLASDGLWDVMTNQEAVSFVRRTMKRNLSRVDGKTISHFRAKMAARLAREAIRLRSGDNVCVVIVWLDNNSEKKG